jgi:trehalose/maltose hydrolase-like predicted phosphorylase
MKNGKRDHSTHPAWPGRWTRLTFTFLQKGKPVFVDLRKV